MNNNNIYTIIKNKLQKLDQTKLYLEKLQKDLELLQEERQLKGISYDDIGGSRGNGVSDRTGETAVRIADKETELRLEIKKVLNEVNHIEKLLNSLHEDEREVIIGIYMQGQQYWVVAQKMKCSITTAKRRRREAFDKILTGYYGNDC